MPPSLAEILETEKSKRYFDEVIEHRRQMRGRDDVEVQYAVLAKLLATYRSGDLAAILRDTKKLSQKDSPVIRGLSTYLSAAILRYSFHNRKAALPKYKTCVEQARTYLPRNHILLGMILGDAASLHREMGMLEEAEAMIEEALEIGRKTIPTHPFMLEGLIKFGDEMSRQKRHSKAMMLYKEALGYARKRSEINKNEDWVKGY